MGWLVVKMVGLLVGWWVDWSVCCLITLLIARFDAWLFGCSVDRMVGWSVFWLISWLVRCLVGRLHCWLVV